MTIEKIDFQLTSISFELSGGAVAEYGDDFRNLVFWIITGTGTHHMT